MAQVGVLGRRDELLVESAQLQHRAPWAEHVAAHHRAAKQITGVIAPDRIDVGRGDQPDVLAAGQHLSGDDAGPVPGADLEADRDPVVADGAVVVGDEDDLVRGRLKPFVDGQSASDPGGADHPSARRSMALDDGGGGGIGALVDHHDLSRRGLTGNDAVERPREQLRPADRRDHHRYRGAAHGLRRRSAGVGLAGEPPSRREAARPGVARSTPADRRAEERSAPRGPRVRSASPARSRSRS